MPRDARQAARLAPSSRGEPYVEPHDRPHRQIRAQFSRQRDAYLAQPDVQDEARLSALVAFAGAGPGTRALDLACGPGFLTRALARVGAQAIGVDATAAFLDFARAEFADVPGLAFREGDVRALPFEPARFDLAMSRAAFHHFAEPEAVAAEIARVVRPGGQVVLADMLGSEEARSAEAHDEIERLCDPTHARALAEPEFERLGQSAGLRLEQKLVSELDHELEAWIEHGGPAPAEAAEIRRRMSAWIDAPGPDCLEVRRAEGQIRFRHRVGVFRYVRS